VPGIPRFEIAPHNCFACGTLNAHGLGLTIHVEPDRSWTEVELDRRFEGWEGVIHGGILCTILDEVMAWSLAGRDDWGVTARMSVTFRRPVMVGQSLRADGWITTSRRRLVETEARVVDKATGGELAVSTGTYLAADEERKARLRARYGLRVPTTDDAPDRVDDRTLVAGDEPA
jgi:uncharacterized protein (TIGR00369 family)